MDKSAKSANLETVIKLVFDLPKEALPVACVAMKNHLDGYKEGWAAGLEWAKQTAQQTPRATA